MSLYDSWCGRPPFSKREITQTRINTFSQHTAGIFIRPASRSAPHQCPSLLPYSLQLLFVSSFSTASQFTQVSLSPQPLLKPPSSLPQNWNGSFFLISSPYFFLKKISPWPIPILNIGVVLILFFKQPPPLSLFSPYLFSMGDGVGAVLPSVHAASPLPPTKINVSHMMVLPPRVCTLYVDIFLYNNRCEKLTLS